MHARRVPSLSPLGVLVALLVVLFMAPAIASAHETRTVAGKYKFVVGFLTEPAVADQPNGIDLTVSDVTTGEPVLGLEQSLRAQILVGNRTTEIPLVARFNSPGKYAGYVIPTTNGTWKFRFTGKVNSDVIDETFTSGPGRFGDVQAAQPLQFPAKAPSLVELASQATDAQTVAWIGVIAGVVGIIVGALGLAVAATAFRSVHGVAGAGRSSVSAHPAARPTREMKAK